MIGLKKLGVFVVLLVLLGGGAAALVVSVLAVYVRSRRLLRVTRRARAAAWIGPTAVQEEPRTI